MPHAVFYHLTNSYIKPALKGEVDASETSRRRGCIEAALVYANPSVSYAASSLSEGAFWHCTTQKLSPRAGKVARSAERGAAQRWLQVQRAAGGVASRLLLFTPTPQSATLTAPRPGSLLALHYPKAVPACGESGTKCRKGCGSEVVASATSSRRG